MYTSEMLAALLKSMTAPVWRVAIVLVDTVIFEIQRSETSVPVMTFTFASTTSTFSRLSVDPVPVIRMTPSLAPPSWLQLVKLESRITTSAPSGAFKQDLSTLSKFAFVSEIAVLAPLPCSIAVPTLVKVTSEKPMDPTSPAVEVPEPSCRLPAFTAVSANSKSTCWKLCLSACCFAVHPLEGEVKASPFQSRPGSKVENLIGSAAVPSASNWIQLDPSKEIPFPGSTNIVVPGSI